MDIKYGGPLKKGDYIAIAYNNIMALGWFIEESASTLRFYTPEQVNWAVSHGEKIYKQYIDKNLAKQGRVIKITNPEEILSDDDLTIFLQAEEYLIEKGILTKVELI